MPVITLSPHMPLSRAERVARARVEREGVAEFAVKTADERQVRQLRRLRARLAADERLRVHLVDRTDGGTYLTVIPAETVTVGWFMGEPKIDAPASESWGPPAES